jgi:hypothetical protein
MRDPSCVARCHFYLAERDERLHVAAGADGHDGNAARRRHARLLPRLPLTSHRRDRKARILRIACIGRPVNVREAPLHPTSYTHTHKHTHTRFVLGRNGAPCGTGRMSELSRASCS